MALLAVAMQDGSVAIFNSRGQSMTPTGSGRLTNSGGSGGASALAWHPESLLLAVGWQDGNLGFFAFTEQGAFHYRSSCRRYHMAEMSITHWTPVGDQLLCGDVMGRLSMWRIQRHSDVAMDWDAEKVRTIGG